MPTLTHGPVLGDVTSTSIKIWGRMSSTGSSFNIEYTKFSDGFPGTTVVSANSEGSKDNQIIYRLTGLDSNTRYSYKINDGVSVHGPFDFVTMPTSKEVDFDIYAVNDIHPSTTASIMAQKDINFQHILNKRNEDPNIPAYILASGDLFFEDSSIGDVSFWPTIMDLMPSLSECFKYVPIDSTWDDHDWGGNNAFGTDPNLFNLTGKTREQLKEAYGIVTPKPDPDANGGNGMQWYKVIGNVLIICTDGRYNKEPSPGDNYNLSDGGASFAEPYQYLDVKTWGDEQLAWIKQTIQDNEGQTDFLIIVSSTTVVDNLSEASQRGIASRDSQGLYSKNERNNLLKWIDESSRFNEVIFLTGDDHKFVVWEKKWVQDPQYNTGDSTLTYPRPKHFFKKLNVHELKQTIGATAPSLGPFFIGDEEFRTLLRHGYTHLQVKTSVPRSWIDVTMYSKLSVELLADIEPVFSKRIWSNPELIDVVPATNVYKEYIGRANLVEHDWEEDPGTTPGILSLTTDPPPNGGRLTVHPYRGIYHLRWFEGTGALGLSMSFNNIAGIQLGANVKTGYRIRFRTYRDSSNGLDVSFNTYLRIFALYNNTAPSVEIEPRYEQVAWRQWDLYSLSVTPGEIPDGTTEVRFILASDFIATTLGHDIYDLDDIFISFQKYR